MYNMRILCFIKVFVCVTCVINVSITPVSTMDNIFGISHINEICKPYTNEK